MEQKKKRGRPKKIQIPDEIQKIIDIAQEAHDRDLKEIRQEIQKLKEESREGRWDIPISDPIEYFDRNLSYELTGYRPIDGKHGLDFNPKWFQEARFTYERTGHYTQYQFGTKAYADFWNEEYRRCRDGYTVNGYTITGDQYYFLNYYRLSDLTSTDKAGGGRQESFPNFFVAQYEYFHYVELCKRLRKDAIGLKARGVGFSEIAASIVANTYNCRRDSRSVVAAQKDNYLTTTMNKVNKQLDFCNDHTDGGFFKLRQKKNTELNKRASVIKIIDGQEVESGWMSEIIGINADRPSKIRGDRTDILLYEESGSWPNWKKAYLQGEALVGIQGAKFGIRLAWGTGGDDGPALEGLADAFENPDTYGALPYKHKFTPTEEEVITAYFIPAYAIVNQPGYIDERGWCDPALTKPFLDSQRAKAMKDPAAYVIKCAEFCFTPDEALALEGTNKFNKVLITDQVTRIKLFQEGPKEEIGELNPIYASGSKRTEQDITGFTWIPSNAGKIHIIEHPIWEGSHEDGEGNRITYQEKRDLYVAGIDSIDIGSDQTSEYTKDPSKFCIVIKKRAFGMQEPKYVAYYMDRPGDERDAYKKAILLMKYYNCRANIEATRLTMVNWAKGRGLINYFMRRPRATYPEASTRKVSNAIGTPASLAVISHQTDLIAAYVEDYCDQIWFPEMLDQLNRYTDENKGKFDIIAAMGMAELADEELTGIAPTDVESETAKQFQDIGYYIDEHGYKRFGVIPKQTQMNAPKFNMLPEYDYTRNRTSDPRYR